VLPSDGETISGCQVSSHVGEGVCVDAHGKEVVLVGDEDYWLDLEECEGDCDDDADCVVSPSSKPNLRLVVVSKTLPSGSLV